MPRKIENSQRLVLNPTNGKFEIKVVSEDKNNDPTLTRSNVTKLSVTKSKITRVDFASGDYKTFTYRNDFKIDTITENNDGVSTVYQVNYDGSGNVTSKTITP